MARCRSLLHDNFGVANSLAVLLPQHIQTVLRMITTTKVASAVGYYKGGSNNNGGLSMRRRTFMAATLALPAVARAERERVLKFIAQSDLAIVDPIWTTAYVTRNHGFMVFDTLYGQTG